MVARIYVVDDEPGIADTLVAILRQSGYEASAFYNPRSALEQIEFCCPELVISDIVMPAMSGVEMAVLIRMQHPACKILLFSGNAAFVDFLKVVREQGHEFEILLKPIHPKDFLAKIAGILSPPSC
jgi:DNA-binding NtrC family response regulator